jgi:hypothetical protein
MSEVHTKIASTSADVMSESERNSTRTLIRGRRNASKRVTSFIVIIFISVENLDSDGSITFIKVNGDARAIIILN